MQYSKALKYHSKKTSASSFPQYIAAWFKCNAIRYFEINVSTATGYQNSVDSHFPVLNNNRNQRYVSFIGDRNSTICSTDGWTCQRQPGSNQTNSRLPTTKTKEAAGRYQFFIGEVRNHYDVLNRLVYSPLSSLGLNLVVDNPYEYPPWKSRMRVNGHIPDDFLTDMARYHLSTDGPNLLNEIIEYRNRFRIHNKNVESLPRIIDSIVKNMFIKVECRIRNMAIPLSTSIAHQEYRTLCPCCPTQDNTIWNFG
jgi:hypothetical protein